jgi:hypothetical protein
VGGRRGAGSAACLPVPRRRGAAVAELHAARRCPPQACLP